MEWSRKRHLGASIHFIDDTVDSLCFLERNNEDSLGKESRRETHDGVAGKDQLSQIGQVVEEAGRQLGDVVVLQLQHLQFLKAVEQARWQRLDLVVVELQRLDAGQTWNGLTSVTERPRSTLPFFLRDAPAKRSGGKWYRLLRDRSTSSSWSSPCSRFSSSSSNWLLDRCSTWSRRSVPNTAAGRWRSSLFDRSLACKRCWKQKKNTPLQSTESTSTGPLRVRLARTAFPG